ncbi:MAG: PDC sensor domain-containing protein [Rhodospirillales bacterium]|nr:PDC sensor domain-containing protein [Rhodospirillales bacterium]
MVRRQKSSISTLIRVKSVGELDSCGCGLWVRRDAQGDIVATEQEPRDTCDRHTRSWFRAARTESVAWSDVYIFFTDRKPGITASLRMPALEFLAGMKIGHPVGASGAGASDIAAEAAARLAVLESGPAKSRPVAQPNWVPGGSG